MSDPRQLLVEYAETGSEAAFQELVTRYVDLVYSVALRVVNSDAHLAQDVAQTVFADLARKAGTLSPQVMLGGWLHRHTYFVAMNVVRGERRRQFREREAVEMNMSEDHSEENLALIKPFLDEAINELPPEDRTAIVLRYFEQNDLRSVGDALGSNEDAARKRVSRALDKLHTLLTKRGILLSGAVLATTLSAHAVSAAPVGMATTISTAVLTGTATTSGAAITVLKIMSMTKVKVGIAAAVVAIGMSVPLAIQHNDIAKLRADNAALKQQLQENARLVAENNRLTTLLANANAAASTNDHQREVLKLRGEVGRLQTAASAPQPSALSGAMANPEIQKAIRDQQKAAMAALYKEFAKRLKLSEEQTEKFSDLLADNIMENIEKITAVLRDGKSGDELNAVFAEQDALLLKKVEEMLGPEGRGQYEEYSRDLLSLLTVEQFKGSFTGDKAAKEQKRKQLYAVMQEETAAAMANAGLNAQIIPNLSFRNMASEVEAEKSLKIMDSVYERAAERAKAFLSEKELQQFAKFRTQAMSSTRMSLAVNRKIMAPPSK